MGVESSVFRLIPPGKPDRKHVPSAGEPVKRVDYAGQKEGTCWYYALKLLVDDRVRPKSEDSTMRMEQKALSVNRKKLTKHSSDFMKLRDLAAVETKYLQQKSKEEKLAIFQKLLDETQTPEDKASVLPYITSFMQDQNCQSFALFVEDEWAKSGIKIQKAFLSVFGIEFFPEDKPLSEQYGLFHAATMTVSQMIFQCKKSNWRPERGVEGLIEEIRSHGPHLVSARVGQSLYTTDPIKLQETIEERSVYGWPPNAPRKAENRISHCVVLVGVKVNPSGKSYVYFIDPIDPSQAYQPGTQKVYKVSYARFLEELNRTNGMKFGPDEQDIFVNRYPYAVHM